MSDGEENQVDSETSASNEANRAGLTPVGQCCTLVVKTNGRRDTGRLPATTSERFADGAAIELLADDKLLLWDDGRETIASEVEHYGVRYTAAKLDPSLQGALRLVRGCNADPQMESHLNALCSLFGRQGVDANYSTLLTAAGVVTWVADCLPGGVPIINLWGPPGNESRVLDLIDAVVRRPLAVAAPTLEHLFALPPGLWPTVIVRNPTERLVNILRLAGSARGARMLRAGSVLSLQCSGVIFTRWPIAGPALRIPIRPADLRIDGLTPHEVEEVAHVLGPRLLHYRLSQHALIENCQFDVPGDLTPSSCMLARALGAVVQLAPGLRSRIGEALLQIDEHDKVANSQLPSALVVEALLVADHEGKPEIYFGEIAELVSAISAGREDPITVSGKAVGDIVRNDLGLSANRRSAGHRIVFDHAVRSRIHEVGRNNGVLSLLEPRPDCRFCGESGGACEANSGAPSAQSARTASTTHTDEI